MTVSELLTRWLDVRPGEVRKVLVSFFGAYSIISFLILAKALREALYLTAFNVTTLPYITIAAAVISLPAAGLFGRMMGRGNPHRVYGGFIVILGAAIASLQLIANAAPRLTTVAFYLVTLLGTSLLTSGFWMVTSEQFSIRQAKRMFGLIGAGGTLGAMITGISLSVLTDSFTPIQLVLGLVAILAGTFILQLCTPRIPPHHHHAGEKSAGVREGLALVFERPHLRNIAAVVLVATMASTVLDYQFKEIVSRNLTTPGDMTAFFGAFYGWTGLIALLIQLFVVARLMRTGGIAFSLSVLPVVLLAGSAALLVWPTLLVATVARGADSSLRKSLHRSVLEVLYVPVPPFVRRRTKAFIDSVVDSVAGGLGAALVFLWVTLGGLPSRYLSIFVIVLAVAFIYRGLGTGRQYTRTVRDRLETDGDHIDTSGFDSRNLLTMTMTRLDITSELAKAGLRLGDDGSIRAAPQESPQQSPEDAGTTIGRISSHDVEVVARALEECDNWDESHVEALTRLLARKAFYARAVHALLQVGQQGVAHLIGVLHDEHADFVIRRRIPRVLSAVDSPEADQALLEALSAGRFEIRYRAAIALSRRRKAGLSLASGNWQAVLWTSIEREVHRERPIWELQKILDGSEAGDDDFVGQRIDVRGELSLEHTFRQLSLVLDASAVKTAYHGIVRGDENLKGLSLEYLEQVLPPAVRERLWPFIGDVNEYQRSKSARSVDEVVSELSQTGVTLFGGAEDRKALRAALRIHDSDAKGEGSGGGKRGGGEQEGGGSEEDSRDEKGSGGERGS